MPFGVIPGRHNMSTKKNEKKNKKQLTSKKGDIAKTVNKHPEVVRLKKEQVKELNEYLDKNRFYAYNDPKKFDEGMRMLGLNPEDTDKIVDVAGGAMRKDKVPELRELIARQKSDLRELKRKLSVEMSTANS